MTKEELIEKLKTKYLELSLLYGELENTGEEIENIVDEYDGVIFRDGDKIYDYKKLYESCYKTADDIDMIYKLLGW